MKSKETKGMILVVEDEWPLLTAITKKLTSSGYAVVGARTVQHARNLLTEDTRVDAVWLDHYVLGSESGLDLVEELKQSEQHSNVPVFVVSNTASSEKVEAYLELGITRYFTKSDYRLDDIIGVITAEVVV